MTEKLNPVEALKLAMEKEEEAIVLYNKLGIDNPTAKDIFEFLSNEEHKHKKLIEKRILELTKY
jgi:rubrerythrin